jgi:hypothetical protein
MDNKIAKIIQKHYPEIANGWHVPLWAVITSINETPKSGSLSDPYRPYYCASVKILDKAGKETNTPILSNIALSGSFSPSGGIMQIPEPGMIVTLQFAFGMPDKPYIDKILPYGIALPGLTTGEAIIQPRQGVKLHFQQDGSINTITDSVINEQSNERNALTGADTVTRQSHITLTNEDSNHEVGGIYQLAAYGALYLLTTGNGELSALKNLSLTAGENLEEFIYGDRISKIEKKLQFLIKDSESLTLDNTGFHVVTEKGKVRIGNKDVDIVKTLHDLIDIVSQLASTMATHTHTTPKSPTTAPIESGAIAGQGLQSVTLGKKLRLVVL